MPTLEQVAQLISTTGKVVALTGAGISEESAVPTFRGSGGIWESYPPTIYANPPGLVMTLLWRPRRMADFIAEVFGTILRAEPNPAHYALTAMEEMGFLNSIVTQNIDNLHQAAGSKEVIELHGNLLKLRCMRCGHRKLMDRRKLEHMVCSFKRHSLSRLQILRELSRFFPKCDCGGRCRLDVVLFGESLPQDQFSLACKEMEHCDVLLVIGTSGAVYPAASLPCYARAKGAKLVEINPQSSSLSPLSDYLLMGKAAFILPRMVTVLRQLQQPSPQRGPSA